MAQFFADTASIIVLICFIEAPRVISLKLNQTGFDGVLSSLHGARPSRRDGSGFLLSKF